MGDYFFSGGRMLFRIFGYLKNPLKPSGMKQFFSMLGLLAFFSAALVSCESDEDGKVPDPGLSDAALSRLVVRYDEARRTADEVGRALGRTVEYESFYVRKNMRTGDARDTLLYVFNYDDNGFAVVATDRRVNKLLAVAENGPYHPKLIPGMNGYYCGMFFYMTALIDELEALSARPFTADVPDVPGRVESRETRTVGESAEPAITVEWGYRTWPYNTYCRKSDGTLAPAGSAAAAVAQIMEACSFPERMELTYPDAEVASADLDWEKIRQHRNTDMCGVWDCPGDHVAISRIYREIGQQLGLEYGDRYDLPMDFGKMPECLRHFGFRADEVAAYDADRVVGSLKEGKLVCMSGQIADGLQSRGQVWAIDGYRDVETKSELWFVPSDGGAEQKLEETAETVRYIHCNWGWSSDTSGEMNGYFAVDLYRNAAGDAAHWGGDMLPNLQVVTGITPNR